MIRRELSLLKRIFQEVNRCTIHVQDLIQTFEDGLEQSSSLDALPSHLQVEPPKKKPKREKKDKSQRVLSPYNIFFREQRKIIIKKYPDATMGEIAKTIGEAWRSLDDSEKKNYIDMATEAKRQKQGNEILGEEEHHETIRVSSIEETPSKKKKDKKKDKKKHHHDDHDI